MSNPNSNFDPVVMDSFNRCMGRIAKVSNEGGFYTVCNGLGYGSLLEKERFTTIDLKTKKMTMVSWGVSKCDELNSPSVACTMEENAKRFNKTKKAGLQSY